MKHTITILFVFYAIFATGQQESQPPVLLMPGQSVTAKDTAWLIGIQRLKTYEKYAIAYASENDTELIEGLETIGEAMKQSGKRFDELYDLQQKTSAELKTGIDRGNQLNNGTSYLLTAIATENEKQLKLLAEMRGDVKRIGKRQFWNKVAWFSAGVVAGSCGGYLLNR